MVLWYVSTEIKKYVDSIPEPIDTLDKVLSMFKEIYIAPTDKLFIHGKEITSKDAPQIFAKKNLISANPEQFDTLPF